MSMLQKQALRTAIGFIGKETIITQASAFLSDLINNKNQFPLEPGEADIIGILYEKQGTAIYGIVAIDQDNKITRFLLTKPVHEFIDNALNNI